jgi:hypothetical protein
MGKLGNSHPQYVPIDSADSRELPIVRQVRDEFVDNLIVNGYQAHQVPGEISNDPMHIQVLILI